MISSIVIDASYAYQLVVPGALQSSLRTQTDRWLRGNYLLQAPTLWIYEVTSAFTKGSRFGTLSESASLDFLQLAMELELQLVPPDFALAASAFAWARRLNRANAYDSFYLALAERLECELWTVDQKLVNAAAKPWVRLAGT